MTRAVTTIAIACLLAPGRAALAEATSPLADQRPHPTQTAPAPLPPPGEMARCKSLIDSGLYHAARTRLEPIVELHPAWARAIALLALTYYKENRFAVAAPLFERALAADPEEIAARPYYGWSLYSLGDLDAAGAMFESLVERKPDYTPAHYGLGLVALDRDALDAARRHLETTARLAEQQQDAAMEGRAHARLGDLYVRLDDLPQARRELERAVELFPDEADAFFKLSRVLQRLGDADGAAAARRRHEEARARPGAGRLPG
jgi:tetratricopeptide (TPR) repeat protein